MWKIYEQETIGNKTKNTLKNTLYSAMEPSSKVASMVYKTARPPLESILLYPTAMHPWTLHLSAVPLPISLSCPLSTLGPIFLSFPLQSCNSTTSSSSTRISVNVFLPFLTSFWPFVYLWTKNIHTYIESHVDLYMFVLWQESH